MNMERILYVNQDFCAVAEDGRLTEYIPVRPEDRTGEILIGRVDRIMSGLDAAFVDIGRTRDGFLPLRENSRSFTGGPLRSGDRVAVQIRKEENGQKGVFLSRDLTIPGAYLILMPMNRHVGVSVRIQDEETRERLLRTGKQLSGEEFGLVMREAAAEAAEEELRSELEGLLAQWDDIRAGKLPPASVKDELQRDYGPRGGVQIRETDTLPTDLQRQLKEAGLRKIRLPHGGNIVIDRCEAMTVIDVNSASDSGSGNRRETILRTNLEACRETMIQTRLRNLSGIIIIDFIDMDAAEDRERIRNALADAFREDRIKTVIHGYTSLGLMEMTRKRSRSAAGMTAADRPEI